jgi:serine/threonine protein kinase/WD40 repeat protein
MGAEAHEFPDEELESLLAACDDALAKGDSKSSFDALRTTEGPEQRKLRKKLACVRMLRRLWKPADAPPPPELGRFQIRRELGRGGHGVVYLAFDPRLDREVALKVPRGDLLLTAALRERFRTEARAAAGLDHPNIVPVFETGEVGTTVYIASAFCPGPALDDWLRKRKEPVPPRWAAEVLLALADALQHAHDRGVLHRDLKPANVLLLIQSADSPIPGAVPAPIPALGTLNAEVCTPKITDFGLAKLDSDSGAREQTRSGVVMGTPAYMAPEQAAGRVSAIGAAADVYSLGAILYELLAGRPPFLAETVYDVLQLVRSMEPVPPTKLRARIPRDLETICLKCLEKDPRRRYPTAAELAADLRRYLAGEPIRARPLSAAGRFARWVRRHPSRAALYAVSFLAALASCGAAVSLMYSGLLEDANKQLESLNNGLTAALGDARAAREGEASERKRAVDAREKSDRLASLLAVTRAGHEVRTNRMAVARTLLDGVPPARRGWEWRYLWDQSDDHAIEFRGHDRAATQIAFDPVHPRAATAGMDGTVRIWDTATGREVENLKVGSWVHSVAFAPDGSRLAAAGGDGLLRIWATPPGGASQMLHTLRGHTGPARRVAFNCDGSLLVSAGDDHTVRIWKAAAGTPGPVLRAPIFPGPVFRGTPGNVCGVAFHAYRNAVFATFSANGVPSQLREIDPDTGRVRIIAEGKATAIAPPVMALNPLTGAIAIVLDTSTLGILSPDGKARLDVPLGDGHVDDLAWDPSARLLAAARRDGSVVVFKDMDGAVLATLPRHTGEALSVAFEPGSRRLASCGFDGRVILADAVPGGPPVRLERTGGFSPPAFRADGRELLAGTEDGTIRRLDPSTGAESAPPLRSPAGRRSKRPVNVVACSPVGSVVAAAWSDDPVVRTWDGDNPGPDLANPEPVLALAFRPDGRQLAAAAGNAVRLWDPATGRVESVLTAPPGVSAIPNLDYLPDGRHLLGRGGTQVGSTHIEWVWDLAAGGPPRVYRQTSQHFMRSTGVLADGWVPSCTRGGLALVDVTGNRPDRSVELTGVEAVWGVHPDGRLLAIGLAGERVFLWDSGEEAEALTLPMDRRFAIRILFDPSGRRLAALDNHFSLWIWDAPPKR